MHLPIPDYRLSQQRAGSQEDPRNCVFHTPHHELSLAWTKRRLFLTFGQPHGNIAGVVDRGECTNAPLPLIQTDRRRVVLDCIPPWPILRRLCWGHTAAVPADPAIMDAESFCSLARVYCCFGFGSCGPDADYKMSLPWLAPALGLLRLVRLVSLPLS